MGLACVWTGGQVGPVFPVLLLHLLLPALTMCGIQCAPPQVLWCGGPPPPPPPMQVDPFHTLFGIAGLSLLGFKEVKEVNPVFCLPEELVQRTGVAPKLLKL